MKLKWDNQGIKTPLARARGLGSAKEGAEHWIEQRVTSISSLFLVLWFAWSLAHLDVASFAAVSAWLAQPENAILLILLTFSAFYHATLGVQVIIEDYVHCEGMKVVKLIAQKLFFIAMGVASLFSIMKIAFGG